MKTVSWFRKKYPNYISVAQIKKLTGIRENKIREIIRQGIVTSVSYTTLHSTMVLIPPTELEKIAVYRNKEIRWG